MRPIRAMMVCWLVSSVLLIAQWACAPLSPSIDAAATVAALGTSAGQTLVAQHTPPVAEGQSPFATSSTPTPSPAATLATSDQPPATPTRLTPPANEPTSLTRRPHGPLIHAPYRLIPPDLDGYVSEWEELPYTIAIAVYRPENWRGLADQSVDFTLQWDNTYLYLAARVTDDVLVQTQHGENIFKGDSLELLFDADLSGDYAIAQLNNDDYQIGISPGVLPDQNAEAYLWYPLSRRGTPPPVLVSSHIYEGSYSLEAALPWKLFEIVPSPGATYGLAISSSDNDTPNTAEQQSLISTVITRKLTDPTTWGTLILE